MHTDKKIHLFFNNVEFFYSDYEDLCSDKSWLHLQDTGGYSETGGGWRCIAKEIQKLYKSEICQNGKWAGYYMPYNPAIAIRVKF